MPNSPTVGERGYSEEEFQDILDSAEDNAKTGKEMEFVESLQERFAEFELRMYLTDNQSEWLLRLVGEGK